MTKILLVFLLAGWSIFLPGLTQAQESSSRIGKIGRTLFELQQQFLEHQEEFNIKTKEWKAQQEDFQLLVARLSNENQALTGQIVNLKMQLIRFEEKLESSETVRLARELKDVNAILRSLILFSLNEGPQGEELILKLINNAVSSLPRDLLILYLANQKRQQSQFEQSLGYYGTLVSQFPESPHLTRSIFEMSDVFGKLGKTDEQNTLLLQLSFIKEDNPYVLKAKEKLRAIQSSPTQSADLSKTISDITADISSDTSADAQNLVNPKSENPQKNPEIESQEIDTTGDTASQRPADSAESIADPTSDAATNESESAADHTSDTASVDNKPAIDSDSDNALESADSVADSTSDSVIMTNTIETSDEPSLDTTADTSALKSPEKISPGATDSTKDSSEPVSEK